MLVWCVAAGALGLVMGFVLHLSLRTNPKLDAKQVSSLVGIVVGGTVLALVGRLVACPEALAWYLIGFAIGFFLYAIAYWRNWERQRRRLSMSLEKSRQKQEAAVRASASTTGKSDEDAALRRAFATSAEDLQGVPRRAELVAPVLKGAQILWVDDAPDNNADEMATLKTLGIAVTTARDTTEALSKLKGKTYDAVISDMRRDDVPDEGLRFLRAMGEKRPLTIFYVTELDPSRGAPPGSFAITNRPDNLVHYVMDALERVRS